MSSGAHVEMGVTPGAPPHPLDRKWFLNSKGKTFGPYSGHRMKDFIEEGRINSSTSVVQEGSDNWVDLGTVRLFSRYLNAAEPPVARGQSLSQAPQRVVIEQRIVAPQQSVHDDERPAGFWIRFGAYFIDSLVLLPAMLLIAFVGTLIFGKNFLNGPLLNVFTTLIGAVYFILMNSGPWQATVGKRVCGIRIMRGDGDDIGPGRALGRYLAMFVSAVPLGFGYYMAGFTDQKKALHDMICDTRVVFGKA